MKSTGQGSYSMSDFRSGHSAKPGFFARYSLPILCIVAFLAPFMYMGTARSLKSNQNDVNSWLPDEYEETKTFEWYRQRFETDLFILASWEGCTLDSPKLELLARRLRPSPDASAEDPYLFFKSVISGSDLVRQLQEDQGLTREQAIDRLRGFLVGMDGRQTCLVMTIDPRAEERWERHFQGDPTQKKFMHAVIDHVHETALQVCDIQPEELHLGGPPVDNVAIDVEGQRSLIRLAVVCGVVGLVVSWWCLRSWGLTAMVFTTGIFSAGLSMVAVWLSGNHMNAILLTMPALVYVAAVSGAIHMANYYRDTLRRQQAAGLADPAAGAPDGAVREAWLPLFLATGTTAFGLASLSVSELLPVKQFGVFSAVGVIVSFIFLCLYMPSLLQEFPIRSLIKPRKSSFFDPGRWSGWNYVGNWILSRHGWVIAGSLVLMVLGVYGASKIETSVKLMKLFSPEADIIHDYAWLEEKLGPLVPMEVVLRIDKDGCNMDLLEQIKLVHTVQAAIDRLPDVGSAVAVPTFARSIPHRPGMVERRTWIVQLQRHREQLKDYWQTEDNEELWRISARVQALTDLDYGDFVADIRGVVEPILDRYRAQGAEGLRAEYTGMVPLVYKAQHSLLNGLLTGFAGDLLLIGVAMMLLMRDWSSGILLGCSSVFPIVVVFGAMGWLGIVVDVGTVMTPAVALGVTVDDAIHFMLWCRHGQERGMNRRQSIMFAYHDCAQAIYQSWGVIGLGLSAFALSSFVPTQRFGYLMFFMLTVSSFSNLVLLPALLASPLANFFWRSGARAAEKKRAKHRDAAERPDLPQPQSEKADGLDTARERRVARHAPQDDFLADHVPVAAAVEDHAGPHLTPAQLERGKGRLLRPDAPHRKRKNGPPLPPS
ncbi:MAG: MMPL family transporter [Thermogutta sp.]|nr:MMPL family transporter [Thermogutta sp.]